MSEGFADKLDQIGPTFKKVFDEVCPDRTALYKMTILPAAWKPVWTDVHEIGGMLSSHDIS